jgi:hypothetical protein
MKAILITIMLVLSGTVLATPPTNGYNYKKHYKKCKRVKAMNRIFNLNGCKHHTQRI